MGCIGSSARRAGIFGFVDIALPDGLLGAARPAIRTYFKPLQMSGTLSGSVKAGFKILYPIISRVVVNLISFEPLFISVFRVVFFSTTKVVSADSSDSGRKKPFYLVMCFFLQYCINYSVFAELFFEFSMIRDWSMR